MGFSAAATGSQALDRRDTRSGRSRMLAPWMSLSSCLCLCLWLSWSGLALAADGARAEAELPGAPTGDATPATGPRADASGSVEEIAPDPLFDDEFGDEFDLDFEDMKVGFPDPLERPNRAILRFNQAVDVWLFDPITRFYRFVLPEEIRRSVGRFFDNVNSPRVIVNDVLQLEWKDAGVGSARLAINSTLGIGGLFDPASSFGLEQHKSDFGQTLALAGVPSGPYFLIPLLGPTTARDGVGLGVDALLHPTFYLLGGTEMIFYGGGAGISERARHFLELKALEDSSVDFYAALRSGYYQNRLGEIWSRREARRPPGSE